VLTSDGQEGLTAVVANAGSCSPPQVYGFGVWDFGLAHFRGDAGPTLGNPCLTAVPIISSEMKHPYLLLRKVQVVIPQCLGGQDGPCKLLDSIVAPLSVRAIVPCLMSLSSNFCDLEKRSAFDIAFRLA
jgi:hypothetical protein